MNAWNPPPTDWSLTSVSSSMSVAGALAHQFDDKPLDLTGRDTVLLIHALKRMCGELDHSNAVLVAAAGNDREGAQYLSSATCQISSFLSSVIGVGAIGANGVDAAYTNIADNPFFPDGVRAFGGDINPTPAIGTVHIMDATTGMLGVYIGLLPD